MPGVMPKSGSQLRTVRGVVLCRGCVGKAGQASALPDENNLESCLLTRLYER